MLKLLKIKKSKNLEETDEIIEAVEETAQEIDSIIDEKLPQIQLFISTDQLAQLNRPDEEREQQAMMYLKAKEHGNADQKVYKEYKEKFDKAYVKLGNEESRCPHCRREYTSAPTEVKKCLGCGKAFFRAKRPQDGVSVLVREENREIFKMQWENIRKAELVKGLDSNELEKVRLRLEQQNGNKYTSYDAHFMLIRSYTAKALKSGRFRLYSSLIYYMAEHDRYKKEFAKALSHYFYIYFLQLNGASNSVVFGDKVKVNDRIIERIRSLLKMASMMTTDCEDFYRYSIETLTAFDLENLPYGVDESYAHLVKIFEREEGREVVEVTQEKAKRKAFGLRR